MLEVICDGKKLDVDIWSFPAGDQGVCIEEVGYGTNIVVKAPLNNSDDIMLLLLTCNAVKNQKHNNCMLKLIIPYVPYAQQDRVCNTGEALSIEVMAALINSIGFRAVEIWDPHSQVTIDLIDNCVPKYQEDFIEYFPKGLLNALSTGVIICPDRGAVLRTTSLASEFDAPVIFGKKKRDLKTGYIEFIGISDKQKRDLRGKTAVIVDDLCVGGGTFIPHAKDAREMGAEKVVLFVTHGVFSRGLSVFNGIIDEIYCTDSYTPAEDISVGYTGKFERFSPK